MEDEDRVVCVLAREYGLFNMRAVRPSIAGTLLAGAGEKTTERVLLSYCCDRLSDILWSLSGGDGSGNDRPPSILKALLGEIEEVPEMIGFDSPEEFWEAFNG